jgi:hypothetical protein
MLNYNLFQKVNPIKKGEDNYVINILMVMIHLCPPPPPPIKKKKKKRERKFLYISAKTASK